MTSNVLKLLPCSLPVRRSRGGISNTGWVFNHYPLCSVESRESTDKHRLFADFYRGDFDHHPLYFLLNVRFLLCLSAFPLPSCPSFLLPMYGTRWVFTPLQRWVFTPSSKLTRVLLLQVRLYLLYFFLCHYSPTVRQDINALCPWPFWASCTHIDFIKKSQSH